MGINHHQQISCGNRTERVYYFAVLFLQLQSFIVDTIVRIEYHSSSKHLLVIRGLYLAGYIVDRNLALPKNNHGSANEHISQALQT